MKAQDLIDFLDEIFHPEYQESYDNSGFLVGDGQREVTGVLVTLDVTEEVVEEAIDKGFNIIVSHHPLIFSGVKRITTKNETGRLLMRILEKGLLVYAAHTNLDNLLWGVNGVLADHLKLKNRTILQPQKNRNEEVGAGLVGLLPYPMKREEFLAFVKEELGLPVLRCSAPRKEVVEKVAICGGAGNFLIDDAKREKVDIFLTGDLKYHDFQRAEKELQLVDIGHYESEQFAKELIFRTISEKFSNFACQIAEEKQGYIYYI